MVDRSKTPARREAMRGKVAEFVRRRLAAKIGWGTKPFELRIPDGGSQSVLYIAEAEGELPVLVRIVEDARTHRRHARALDEAARHNAPTPRCLYRGTGWFDKLMHGNRYIAESHVPGRQLDRQPATPEMMRAAARSLAELHRGESDYWGFAGEPEKGRFEEDLRKKVERRLADLSEGKRSLPRDLREQIDQWFNEKLQAFRGVNKFQLCHLNLGNDDILYDPATDKVWFVDCGTLEYNRASNDLASFQPFLKSWIGTDEAHADFMEEYLRHSPSERRGEVEREAPFFAAYLCLSRLRSRGGKRSAQQNGQQGESAPGQSSYMLNHLLRITKIERDGA